MNYEDHKRKIDTHFNDAAYHETRGVPFENYTTGTRYHEFEKFPKWKGDLGYSFDIYSNDHLIDGVPHFHFTKKSENINSRIKFDGTLILSRGKLPNKKVLKLLSSFLKDQTVQESMINMWNLKNPQCQYP